MATRAQRTATSAHRRRAAARGLVRVEVQASKGDADLIRAVAQTLRGEPTRAASFRSALAGSLAQDAPANAFDVFGSDLPDEVFKGVFDPSRREGWRKVEL
jgi:hypothetical protein